MSKLKICFSSSYNSEPFIASFLARQHLIFTTMRQQKESGQTRFFLKEQCPDIESTTTIVYWGHETGFIDFGWRVREGGLLSRIRGHDSYVGESSNGLGHIEFKIPTYSDNDSTINCCHASDEILQWILDCSSQYGFTDLKKLEGDKAVEIGKEDLKDVKSFKKNITESGWTDLQNFKKLLNHDSISIEQHGDKRRQAYEAPRLTDLAAYDDVDLERLMEDVVTAWQYRKRLSKLKDSVVDKHSGFTFPKEVFQKLAGPNDEPELRPTADKVYESATKQRN